MAIELHVRKPGELAEAAHSVPVATAANFDLYWAPLASELGLKWIPLFRTGFPVEQADVPFVVDELVLLRKHLAAKGGVAAETVLPRLNGLLTELTSVANSYGAELYIG